jgi:uncharacterized protein (TIGR04255 family)
MPVQRAFRDLLGSEWVIESQQIQQVKMEVGPGMGSPDFQRMTIPRFTVRDRTVAVAISSQSLTIETTRYKGYDAFRPTAETALLAAEKVLTPDGIARVGMRFIDEIRAPGADKDHPEEWNKWIRPALLGPGAPEHPSGLKLTGLQGLAQFETGSDRTIVVRYGPSYGHAVNSQGPLKRPGAPEPGPFFLLDFDSAWMPLDIPEFSTASLVGECDRLHEPIEGLFDSFITPELLAIFRKEGDAE